MKILQPSCSPKNSMFDPTTGPEIEQRGRPGAGAGRDELPQRLGGHDRPRARSEPEPARPPPRRAPRGQAGQEAPSFCQHRTRESLTWNTRGRPGGLVLDGHPAAECGCGYRLRPTAWSRARRRGRTDGGLRRLGHLGDLGLRCMSTLPRKCAPSAMATRGATMLPSTYPLSRMSTFSLAVMLPDHLAEHDDRLGENLGLDSPVRADGEHVLPQLDLAPRRGLPP